MAAKNKPETASKKDKKKDKKKSFTDVIAVELMEKAKKTLEVDSSVKKEGTRTPSPPPAPLITEKEPEPPTPPTINTPLSPESEHDDEFNIPTISEIKTSAGGSNLHKKELSQLQELQNRIYQTKKKLKELDSESDEEAPKKSVLSRLGVKPTENSKPSNIISLSAIRRTEKEIYVAPSFRKLIERQKEDNDKRTRRNQRSRTRSRSRERARIRRRSRSPIRRVERSPIRRVERKIDRSPIRRSERSPMRRVERSKSPPTRPSIHQRIGSKIVEKPAKQRPTISSAVAGKSLLLRAVAEAQRSTAGTNEPRKRDNIVVRVPLRKDKRNIRMEEEYVPESISTQSESEAEYHPRAVADDADDGDVIYLNNNEDVDLEDLDNDKSPQFVVTLEGVPQFDEQTKSSHSPTPPPVIKRKSIKDRIGFRATKEERREPVKRAAEEEESESQRAYNRAKRARVSPIKFDLTDDEENGKSRDTSRDRRSETPEAKEDEEKKENGDESAKRIRLETTRSFDHVPPCKLFFTSLSQSFNCKIFLQVLSSVAVAVPDSAKPIVKSKERCKFYPLCSNATCAFFHPSLPCKLFPNCKFGDSCAYVHPRCKFDTSCARVDCNFSHSQAVAGQTMPPIGELN